MCSLCRYFSPECTTGMSESEATGSLVLGGIFLYFYTSFLGLPFFAVCFAPFDDFYFR